MKYILVQAYCNANIGDDLFLKVLIERYSSKNFIILGNNKNLQFLSTYKNVKIENIYGFSIFQRVMLKLNFLSFDTLKYKMWRKFLDRYQADIDAYIILGGSMFIERSNKTNFDTSDLIMNRLKHATKLIVGSNFGPYKSPEFFNYYKRYFQLFDKIIFRDSFSTSLFSDAKNVLTATDFIFNLDFISSPQIPNSIGISLLDFKHRETSSEHVIGYFNFVSSVIEKARDQNRPCYLFSFCEIEGDASIVQELSSKYSNVVPIYYEGDINVFLGIYSSMETVVCTRFHSLVLSLIFRQKIFCVIYSKKTLNLIKDLDEAIVYREMHEIGQSAANEIDALNIFDIDTVSEKATVYFQELDNYLK